VSVVFWGTLLLAAGAYAAVALAPKLLAYGTLSDEYRGLQTRLVTLERRVQYLERVATALEDDPQFAAELARIDFDAARPGDERIAVAPQHSLDARQAGAHVAHPVTASPAGLPLLRVLAEDRPVRIALLAAAAVACLAAFTFLHDPAGTTPRAPLATATGSRLLHRLAARYRRAG
jgi:cell division protein FtsB